MRVVTYYDSEYYPVVVFQSPCGVRVVTNKDEKVVTATIKFKSPCGVRVVT